MVKTVSRVLTWSVAIGGVTLALLALASSRLPKRFTRANAAGFSSFPLPRKEKRRGTIPPQGRLHEECFEPPDPGAHGTIRPERRCQG